MRFQEGDPITGPLTHPRHHIVRMPDGSIADDALLPHGEAGYAQAVSKIQKLGGGGAKIEYASGSRQYYDPSRKPFPFGWHAEEESKGGDGVVHTQEDWRTERLDLDRLRIADLEELKKGYPDLDILLGVGGEDVSIVHRLPSREGGVRSLLVHSAHTLTRLNPPIPEALARPENLVVIARETGNEGRSLLGLLNVEAWRPSGSLEVRLYEDGLGVDPSEILESVAAGLRMYKTRTNIMDPKYRLATSATCDAHVYEGEFPTHLGIVLDAIEDKKIRLT